MEYLLDITDRKYSYVPIVGDTLVFYEKEPADDPCLGIIIGVYSKKGADDVSNWIKKHPIESDIIWKKFID